MAKKIFCVDDSPIVRQIVQSSLEVEGYAVETAANGLEALENAKINNNIDLFLLDINMPKLDGLNLLKELRKLDHHQNTPVIMITSEDMADKKAMAKKSGATGWIVKPFKPIDLIKIIRKIL